MKKFQWLIHDTSGFYTEGAFCETRNEARRIQSYFKGYVRKAGTWRITEAMIIPKARIGKEI
ncbi:MAG TPA: hypothetical protein VJ044_06770 [Candidatus Hodarchaeales archaeon]|nr:hypothetical protein [Candidatus Hodarchaeales archaeon]